MITRDDTIVDTLGKPGYSSPLRTNSFVDDSKRVLVDIEHDVVTEQYKSGNDVPSFENAGPHKELYFDPGNTSAAIVTCGGLCPGINNVIQGIARMLQFQYGVKRVLGIRYGFEGLVPEYRHDFVELTLDYVQDLHEKGGTVLGSSRGYQDEKIIVDTLVREKIDILFVIGGDGSLRGAHDIYQEIKKRGLPISVVGIPKTIDNDIWFMDKTFGFSTAVSTATQSIYAAHTEAIGAKNGIGLVKVMGRDSGFIASYVTLASNDVNYVFVPEIPFKLHGKGGFLENLHYRLKRRGHAVIVVAEGAGQEYFDGPEGKDASGNPKYKDIGQFMKGTIQQHFSSMDVPVTIKYIDNSYTIRSVPASADDAVYCMMLAQNAVHGAMAGKTGFVVGSWHSYFTYIPLPLVTRKRKRMNPEGYLWSMVTQSTCQPEFC